MAVFWTTKTSPDFHSVWDDKIMTEFSLLGKLALYQHEEKC